MGMCYLKLIILVVCVWRVGGEGAILHLLIVSLAEVMYFFFLLKEEFLED